MSALHEKPSHEDDDSAVLAAARRSALLKQVNGVEKALAAGKKKKALKRLSKIREKTEKWVNEYVARDPRELSKYKVLQQIDSIDARVRSQMGETAP